MSHCHSSSLLGLMRTSLEGSMTYAIVMRLGMRTRTRVVAPSSPLMASVSRWDPTCASTALRGSSSSTTSAAATRWNCSSAQALQDSTLTCTMTEQPADGLCQQVGPHMRVHCAQGVVQQHHIRSCNQVDSGVNKGRSECNAGCVK